MAKIEVQDFRVDLIEAIGRTDNLKILRSIANQMEGFRYTSRINKGELNKIVNEGVEKIKELLGDSVKYFTPLKEIESMSASTYFERMTKGYSDLLEKEKVSLKLENQRMDYDAKISKYKSKGKNDKVKEFEYKLYCINYPNENLARVTDSMASLEARYIAGTISDDQYNAIKKDLKKAEKLSLTTLSMEKHIKDSDVMSYYKTMQEEVRNFLCYLFFDKAGKTTESHNRFLMTYDGEIKVDLEHIILLYNYLKSIGYKNINEIEAVMYYMAIEYLYRDISGFMGNKISIFLKQSPTEFYSEKHSGYVNGYMPYILLPEGYKGYVFEPTNISQQAFISAMDTSNLSLDTMVDSYKNAQSIMRNRENGIFYTFLDKDIENRLMRKLITEEFPLDEMDGPYKDALLSEFRDRRNTFGDNDTFGVMTNMYSRVVKPYALEVLGSYIRKFCVNLSQLEDKNSIFIYYVSAERVAIAVREDIEYDMLKQVFPEVFLNVLNEVEKPTLEDIAFGRIL